MKYFLIGFCIMLFSGFAFADSIYIKGGVARSFNSDYGVERNNTICKYKKYKCENYVFAEDLGNDFGRLEAGYEMNLQNNFSLGTYVQHISSFDVNDRGLNMVGVDLIYRWNL